MGACWVPQHQPNDTSGSPIMDHAGCTHSWAWWLPERTEYEHRAGSAGLGVEPPSRPWPQFPCLAEPCLGGRHAVSPSGSCLWVAWAGVWVRCRQVTARLAGPQLPHLSDRRQRFMQAPCCGQALPTHGLPDSAPRGLWQPADAGPGLGQCRAGAWGVGHAGTWCAEPTCTGRSCW